MPMEFNAFARRDNYWYWVKATLRNILIAILFTFVISLVLGFKYKIIATASMTPTLAVNSLVILAPVDEITDLKVGDIVTFGTVDGKTEYTFTHRIHEIRVEDNMIVTGGDANIGADGEQKLDAPTKFNRVVGKVVANFNFVGYVITYIKQNLFMVAFAIVVLFVSYLIFN